MRGNEDERKRKRTARSDDVIDVDALEERAPPASTTFDVEVIDITQPQPPPTKAGTNNPTTKRRPRPRPRVDTSEITPAVPKATGSGSGSRFAPDDVQCIPVPTGGGRGGSSAAHRGSATQGDLETEELTDPSVSVVELFRRYNARHFWGKLAGTYVEFSTRMTSCAGTCTFKGKLGGCRIALSEPLLKYRPRSDLHSTLLHEMIHAYLFVTEGMRGHDGFDGHGPKFLGHASRINAAESYAVNVTPYHTFHDEVELYRVHHWTCQGRCGKVVKRAMNRAPSKHDTWWYQHQAQCGGAFVKTKEPPPKEKKYKKPKAKSRRIDDMLSKKGGDKEKPGKEEKGGGQVLGGNGEKSGGHLLGGKGEKGVKDEKGGARHLVAKECHGEGRALGVKDENGNVCVIDVKDEVNGGAPLVKEEEASCPVCQRTFPVSRMNAHLDVCLAASDAKVSPPAAAVPNIPLSGRLYWERHLGGGSSSAGQSRRPALGDDDVVAACSARKVTCPVCAVRVEERLMDAHLDHCLSSKAGANDDEGAACGVQRVFGGDDALLAMAARGAPPPVSVPAGCEMMELLRTSCDKAPLTPFNAVLSPKHIVEDARSLLAAGWSAAERGAVSQFTDTAVQLTAENDEVIDLSSPVTASRPQSRDDAVTPSRPGVPPTPSREPTKTPTWHGAAPTPSHQSARTPTHHGTPLRVTTKETPPRPGDNWWQRPPPVTGCAPAASPSRGKRPPTEKGGGRVQAASSSLGKRPRVGKPQAETTRGSDKFFTPKEPTACPLCNNMIPRAQLNAHVNACLDESGVAMQIDEETSSRPPPAPAPLQVRTTPHRPPPVPQQARATPRRPPPAPQQAPPYRHPAPHQAAPSQTHGLQHRPSPGQTISSRAHDAQRRPSPGQSVSSRRTSPGHATPSRRHTPHQVPSSHNTAPSRTLAPPQHGTPRRAGLSGTRTPRQLAAPRQAAPSRSHAPAHRASHAKAPSQLTVTPRPNPYAGRTTAARGRSATMSMTPCPICDRMMRRDQLDAHTSKCLAESGFNFS